MTYQRKFLSHQRKNKTKTNHTCKDVDIDEERKGGGRDEMMETLYKKAKGYDVEEISSEYSVDENGQKVLIKEKRTVKHVPPDLASIKAYMELKDAEIYGLDSEELKKEKIRLLKELKAEEAKCKKKK